MDKSGANKAAMDEINAQDKTPIIVRQVKYLNNILEQDHRAIKRVTRPMLNFKSFRSAKSVLASIEFMHMMRKGQLLLQSGIKLSFADQFYTLAGKTRRVCGIGNRSRPKPLHHSTTRQRDSAVQSSVTGDEQLSFLPPPFCPL